MISSFQQRRLYVSLSLLGFCLAFILLLPWEFTAVQASVGVYSNANITLNSGTVNLLEKGRNETFIAEEALQKLLMFGKLLRKNIKTSTIGRIRS